MKHHRDLSTAQWRKSSYSGNTGGACVEVAPLPDTVAVRDSKYRDGGNLVVSATAWSAFVRTVAR